jgi:hypothetical protein
MADNREETVILTFEVDEGQSIETIAQLTAANKALRQERNQVNIATEAGKKRAQELNAIIDANTAKIKENVSAIEQQKINIGNYGSALDRVLPGMGQFTQTLTTSAQESGGFINGLKGMASGLWTATKASLAFLATPLGAAIAAISAALAILGKFLFGTQEGMDRLNAVMRPLGAIMERMVGVVQNLGGRAFKALGEAIENPTQAMKDLGKIIVDNVLNRFKALALFGPAIKKVLSGDIKEGFRDLNNAAIQAATGIEDGIGKIERAAKGLSDFVSESVEQGKRLDELQKQIERGEINQIVRARRLQLIIAEQKKLVEDTTKSFDERIQAAQRAQTAQSELLNTELSLLDKRIEKMELEQSLNDTSREQERELAELQARRLELQANMTERSIEFQNKLNDLRKQERDQILKQLEDERKAQDDKIGYQVKTQEEFVKSAELAAQSMLNIRARSAQDFAKIAEDQEKEERQRAFRRIEIEEMVQDQKLAAAEAVMGGVLGFLDQQSEAYKAIASAQVLVSTYSAATKAYEAAFLPIPTVASPALGVAFAAAAVAQGLANIAKINGVEFAEGGWTGPGDKYKVAGVVHADEYVVPKHIVNNPAANHHISALERMRLQPYADGGLVTRSISNPIDQAQDMSRIIKDLQIVLDVREVTKQQKAIQVKQAISKR